jgi:hypothetical protein
MDANWCALPTCQPAVKPQPERNQKVSYARTVEADPLVLLLALSWNCSQVQSPNSCLCDIKQRASLRVQTLEPELT